MRRLSKEHEDTLNSVETLLSSNDDDVIEPLALDKAGSVGSWAHIIRAAKASAPEVDTGAVTQAVLAEIRSTLTDQPTRFSFVNRATVGFALSAAACLVLFVSVSSRVSDTTITETPQATIAALEAELQRPKVPAPVSVASLSSTTVNSGQRGAVHLSNQNRTSTIRLTDPLRLDAVNGNLQINLLSTTNI